MHSPEQYPSSSCPPLGPRSHSSVPAATKSPHCVKQFEGSPSQYHPVWIWQVSSVHPSWPLRLVLASLPGVTAMLSHCSSPKMSPSPQIASQEDGWPEQVQPVSCTQFSPQPSPAVSLLSSQFSSPRMKPSPHTVSQAVGSESSQSHPRSRKQVLEQPSSESVAPSSHNSFPRTNPSPQMGLQRDCSLALT